MSINKAISEIEATNYKNEELMTLFEYYAEARKESWQNQYEIENATTHYLALRETILHRMNERKD